MNRFSLGLDVGANMVDRRSAVSSLALLLTTGKLLTAGQGQPPAASADAGLTVEEIVRLTRAGVAEDLIIAKLKKNGKAFDLSKEELLDLKKYGVSDTVAKFMLDPSQPYAPPAVAAPPRQPTKKYQADPFASRVPADPGLYLFPASLPVDIGLKVLLGSEAPKKFMKKRKTVAYLIGPSSKTRIKTPLPNFYLRLAEGKQIEEVILITFSSTDERRELDIGSAGPKEQFKAEEIRQYDSLEVGPQLFKITAPRLPAGEYTFLLIGSADPSKGIFGKGYDFGVDEVEPPKNKKSKK